MRWKAWIVFAGSWRKANDKAPWEASADDGSIGHVIRDGADTWRGPVRHSLVVRVKHVRADEGSIVRLEAAKRPSINCDPSAMSGAQSFESTSEPLQGFFCACGAVRHLHLEVCDDQQRLFSIEHDVLYRQDTRQALACLKLVGERHEAHACWTVARHEVNCKNLIRLAGPVYQVLKKATVSTNNVSYPFSTDLQPESFRRDHSPKCIGSLEHMGASAAASRASCPALRLVSHSDLLKKTLVLVKLPESIKRKKVWDALSKSRS